MLTTGYENTIDLQQDTWEMVADWLACGLDPNKATFFVQSRLPEHAELHLLFSMVTPLGWLERVPTYKEQLENIQDHDINTYGFLGYPLLQAADILMYKANAVPVGEDQVPHVELTREVARRFNQAFGKLHLKKRSAQEWIAWGAGVRNLGRPPAGKAEDFIRENYQRASLDVRAEYLNRDVGTLEPIFPEPEALLTSSPRLPGSDGRKMSKSYAQRDFPDRRAGSGFEEAGGVCDGSRPPTSQATPAILTSARYSTCTRSFRSRETIDRVNRECRTAEIGCVDCKKLSAGHLNAFLAPIHERRKPLEQNPQKVWDVLEEGTAKARTVAQTTMAEVRKAVNLVP